MNRQIKRVGRGKRGMLSYEEMTKITEVKKKGKWNEKKREKYN